MKKKTLSSKTKKPVLNSFFAGIGGFELGFERQGFETGFICEKDDFCRNVLKRHWPNVRCSKDIAELSVREIPEANVWTAGFPCQDLSLARTPHGRSGLKGSQSGLFFKLIDLMTEHDPEVVLMENVAGLLNSHSGNDFKVLIKSLTELGYGVAWRVLNARYFGVPQSRPRIFICAWRQQPEKAVRALFEESAAPLPKNERAGFITQSKSSRSKVIVPEVSFCISATSGRHTGLDWARSYVTHPDAVRRLTPVECERLQGLPDDWTVPDRTYSIPARGIDSERYRAIGNAVSVPVVEWVAKRIHDLLLAEKSACRKARDFDFLQGLAQEFSLSSARQLTLKGNSAEIKWKTGGVAFGDYVVDSQASTAPLVPITTSFADLIEDVEVNFRYFLSSNAAQGIIRRVDRLGRKLFSPLDSTLRLLAKS